MQIYIYSISDLKQVFNCYVLSTMRLSADSAQSHMVHVHKSEYISTLSNEN